MKGMVVMPILGYFLNNILSFSFFTLKFGIWNLEHIYKIIQIFILLSRLRAFISNAIFTVSCQNNKLNYYVVLNLLLTWVSPALSNNGAGYIPVVR